MLVRMLPRPGRVYQTRTTYSVYRLAEHLTRPCAVLLVRLCDLYNGPRQCAGEIQGDPSHKPYVESLPW